MLRIDLGAHNYLLRLVVIFADLDVRRVLKRLNVLRFVHLDVMFLLSSYTFGRYVISSTFIVATGIYTCFGFLYMELLICEMFSQNICRVFKKEKSHFNVDFAMRILI